MELEIKAKALYSVALTGNLHAVKLLLGAQASQNIFLPIDVRYIWQQARVFQKLL